jgi:NADH-quinone oxidoreductase subunit C
MHNQETFINKINEKYHELIDDISYTDNTVYVKSLNLIEFMTSIKTDKDFLFNMLCDHTAVDWIDQEKFDMIYNLYSTVYKFQIFVVVAIPRSKPIIDTVSSIWRIAEWQEREVYDFFGVIYKKHPDLRRLFLEDDWVGFPLRKDYKDNFILEM